MKPGHGLFRASKNQINSTDPSGCHACAMESRLDAFARGHEEYCRLVNELNSSLKPIDDYVNSGTPIRHMCMLCGDVRPHRPSDVLNGHHRCPSDSKSKSDFVSCKERSIEMYGDVIDWSKFDQRNFEYDKADIMICKKCRHEWRRSMHTHLKPSSREQNLPCTNCSPRHWTEGAVADFLKLKFSDKTVKRLGNQKYIQNATTGCGLSFGTHSTSS